MVTVRMNAACGHAVDMRFDSNRIAKLEQLYHESRLCACCARKKKGTEDVRVTRHKAPANYQTMMEYQHV